MNRPSTPPRPTSHGTTYRIKRHCNGCTADLGDATEAEIAAVVEGRALPDVRDECPQCGSGSQATPTGPTQQPGNGPTRACERPEESRTPNPSPNA